MLIVNISDFSRNAAQVLDAALTNEVIINNGGKQYKIVPMSKDTAKDISPLENIPCITADITTQEMVDLIRESRAGI